MKTLALLFFLTTLLFAQQSSLYMSVPIKEAYKNKTRSWNGEPGSNYWQNKSNYKISAEINPETKILDGKEAVTYFNESPDTLKKIVMRLYPDFYKKGNARDFQISPEAVNEGVYIKELKVRGNEIDVSDESETISRTGTLLNIKLDEPLLPGSDISIDVEWSFIIPSESPVRFGAYTDTSMFVGYWYPQVAVYDDIDGWDEISYTGLTEMYNDFSNYEVKIKAPKNYLIWATGVLQNPEEVLKPEYLRRYNKARQSDTTHHIITKNDLNKNITVGDYSTWFYKADNVPDFAFATAINYLWDASTMTLENGKEVFTAATYKSEANYFDKVDYVLREAINYFSREIPGIDFPFPEITVFNGSGGMEYPMMINDGETSSYESMVGLTMHELAHTYFPFYMGTNEKRYAFMDEGMAVFLPTLKQNELGEYNTMATRYKRYDQQAKTITAVPPMVPSYGLDYMNYRMNSYTRAGAAYFSLQEQLGKELFLEALHEYMNRWNGKHPTAYDMFFTFDDVTGQDLTWFWQRWFFEFGIAAMELTDYNIKVGKKEVTIKNIGGLPMPIVLNIYYSDNTEETIIKKPEVWKEGNEEVVVNLNTDKKITMITLGNDFYPNISEKTKFNINE